MEIKDRILVVEDDKRISSFFKTVLESNRYDVIMASTGSEAYSLITSQCPDLVILDLGLPDMDGMNILRSVREWSSMPVIVVSARTHEKDKVEALDLGADDYITKPFGTSELLARIRTAIRHSRAAFLNQGGAPTGTFVSGGLTIDYDKHRVFVDGTDAGLTQNEYKIVSLLGKYAGKVMTYDSIIKEIWGPNMKNDNRILRVNMANIRRKIEKILRSPSIFSRRWAWATGSWSRIKGRPGCRWNGRYSPFPPSWSEARQGWRRWWRRYCGEGQWLLGGYGPGAF